MFYLINGLINAPRCEEAPNLFPIGRPRLKIGHDGLFIKLNHERSPC